MKLLPELTRRAEQATKDPATLRPYQSGELIPFMHAHPFSGCYVDMGLGKTVSTLTMLNDLFTTGQARKALIIAPLRVAVQTWPTEIEEWSHTWWMTYTVIRPDRKHPGAIAAQKAARFRERGLDFGSPSHAARKALTAHLELQRRQLANSPAMIHIINREAVDWLANYHGKKWPYDVVVIDESTSFSDHNTKRWKALNRVRPYVKRLHLLSGVPAPEGITDYFGQIYLLDRGERFGRGITHFRKTYTDEDKYTRKVTPKPGAEKAVARKISDICCIMREEDYLDLGKPTVIQRPIILEPDEMRLYKKFARELILELPNDVEIEAENGSALHQKLMQFASGAVYDAERKVHPVHEHKLEELMEVRSELQGSPLLIAYWHKSSLARLRKLLPKAIVMDREAKAVKPWNDGRIQDLLIHPQSAGHGLNMQYGPGHTLLFFDNPFPLELYMQTIKRIARPGQKKPVKVIHLTTRGTIDEAVVPGLIEKDKSQDRVRQYIRDLRAQNGRR